MLLRSRILQKLDRVAVWIGDHRDRDARTELGDGHGRADAFRLELRHQSADIGDRDCEVAHAKSAHRSAGRRFCSRRLVELQQFDDGGSAFEAIHPAAWQRQPPPPPQAEPVAIETDGGLLVSHYDSQIDRVFAYLHSVTSRAKLRTKRTLANHAASVHRLTAGRKR